MNSLEVALCTGDHVALQDVLLNAFHGLSGMELFSDGLVMDKH